MNIEELIEKYGLVKDTSCNFGTFSEINNRYRWEDGIPVSGNAIGITEHNNVVFATNAEFSKAHNKIVFVSWINGYVPEEKYEDYIKLLKKQYDAAVKKYKKHRMNLKIKKNAKSV